MQKVHRGPRAERWGLQSFGGVDGACSLGREVGDDVGPERAMAPNAAAPREATGCPGASHLSPTAGRGPRRAS